MSNLEGERDRLREINRVYKEKTEAIPVNIPRATMEPTGNAEPTLILYRHETTWWFQYPGQT